MFFAIAFCGMTLGFATSYFPEYAKARMSAALIFKMMDETPKIDSYATTGLKPVSYNTSKTRVIKMKKKILPYLRI